MFCGRPACEFCVRILAGWIHLPPVMVWNWVSILHASILDTFIFGSLKLDSDVIRPQMRESLWENCKALGPQAENRQIMSIFIFYGHQFCLIIVESLLVAGLFVAVLMGEHHVKEKPINTKYINIIHTCTLPCYTRQQQSPHQSDISPLFDLFLASFREQIKAGPEGSGMGLIHSLNFLHYINI